MFVLVCGDLHGDIKAARMAVDTASRYGCDYVLQAGDFGYWTHTARGVAFIAELNKYLRENGITLYWVDGNHENFDKLYENPLGEDGLRRITSNIIHIPRGKVVELDGVRIMGFGGANSIDGPNGADWWPQARGMYTNKLGDQINLGGWWWQEDITQEQVDAVNETADLLITHDAPEGVMIPGITKTYHAGDRSRRLMSQVVNKVQPKAMFHGHYHVFYESELNGMPVIGLSHNGDVLQNMVRVLDLEDYK